MDIYKVPLNQVSKAPEAHPHPLVYLCQISWPSYDRKIFKIEVTWYHPHPQWHFRADAATPAYCWTSCILFLTYLAISDDPIEVLAPTSLTATDEVNCWACLLWLSGVTSVAEKGAGVLSRGRLASVLGVAGRARQPAPRSTRVDSSQTLHQPLES
jgi:hypothetical protein